MKFLSLWLSVSLFASSFAQGSESLAEKLGAGKGHVVMIAGVSCPLVRIGKVKLARLAKEKSGEGFRFHLVFSNAGERRTAIEAATKGLEGVNVIHDPNSEIADLLGATTLSQTFVLDGNYKTIYSGPFDDQHSFEDEGRGVVGKKVANQTYVADALLGKKVESRRGIGCAINRDSLTYWKDIQPIFANRCVGCHRDGGIQSNLPLTEPDLFRHMLPTIRTRVKDRIMPPWGAVPTEIAFRNDVSLKPDEYSKVLRWIEEGSREGNPTKEQEEWAKAHELTEEAVARREQLQVLMADALAKKEGAEDAIRKLHGTVDSKPTEWHNRELPDVITYYPEVIPISATEWMDYFYGDAVVKRTEVIRLDERRCIEWAEFKTDAPEQMHHAIAVAEIPKEEAFWFEPRNSIEKSLEDDPNEALGGMVAWMANKRFGLNPKNLTKVFNVYGMRGTRAMSVISAFVPGRPSVRYPSEFAACLPKGSKIYMEIHYTPSGEARADQPRLGIKWLKNPPKHELFTMAFGVAGERLRIPPMTPNFTLSREFTFEKRASIFILSPHAHIRGKSFHYELTYPDGRKQVLLDIPRYDFKNQPYYILDNPLLVPAGTKITMTGVFNNFVNPDNERDPRNNKSLTVEQAKNWVPYGLQTEQEMFWGYISFAYLEEFTRHR